MQKNNTAKNTKNMRPQLTVIQPDKSESFFKKMDNGLNLFYLWLDKNCDKAVKAVSKLFVAAVLWVILAYIFPQLREVLPNFYEFVDGIVWCFDQSYRIVLEHIKWLISYF